MLMRLSSRLLTALVVLIPTSVGYRHVHVTQAVANDLQLSVTTGRRTYPLDALVKVTVRAKNVSGHTITLAGPGVVRNGGNPSVVEVDRSGAAVPAPSQFLDYPNIPLTPPTHVELAAGETLSRTLNIIVWSDHLRATVSTGAQSKSLSLHLTGAHPPKVDVHSSGGTITAVVQRPRGVMGPLFYRSSVYCRINDSSANVNEVPSMAAVAGTWGRTHITTFTPPPCPAWDQPSTFSAWRLIVGWRNRSVASVSYGKMAP